MPNQALSAEKILQIKKVALIPFGSFNVEERTIDMTEAVMDELKKHAIDVVEQEVLEGFLARKRIRRTEFLDRPAIRAMAGMMSLRASRSPSKRLPRRCTRI